MFKITAKVDLVFVKMLPEVYDHPSHFDLEMSRVDFPLVIW